MRSLRGSGEEHFAKQSAQLAYSQHSVCVRFRQQHATSRFEHELEESTHENGEFLTESKSDTVGSVHESLVNPAFEGFSEVREDDREKRSSFAFESTPDFVEVERGVDGTSLAHILSQNLPERQQVIHLVPLSYRVKLGWGPVSRSVFRLCDPCLHHTVEGLALLSAFAGKELCDGRTARSGEPRKVTVHVLLKERGVVAGR
jgi:hypothetical protein